MLTITSDGVLKRKGLSKKSNFTLFPTDEVLSQLDKSDYKKSTTAIHLKLLKENGDTHAPVLTRILALAINGAFRINCI